MRADIEQTKECHQSDFIQLNTNRRAYKTGLLERETILNDWMCERASTGLYAPGVAHVSYLPPIEQLNQKLVRFLGSEMKYFFSIRSNDKTAQCWLILPQYEWQNHAQAQQQSATVFWALCAAKAALRRDRKRVKLAMARKLPGYHIEASGNVLNPIVGQITTRDSRPHPQSLLSSALSPLYRHHGHYRYAPTSVMMMTYARDELDQQKRSLQASCIAHFTMIHGNLIEQLGSQSSFSKSDLQQELPTWEALIAKIVRLNPLEQENCDLKEVHRRFLSQSDHYVEQISRMHAPQLPLLKALCAQHSVSAKTVLSSYFAETGLYVTPTYCSP